MPADPAALAAVRTQAEALDAARVILIRLVAPEVSARRNYTIAVHGGYWLCLPCGKISGVPYGEPEHAADCLIAGARAWLAASGNAVETGE
jgi:hypothetical protein